MKALRACAVIALITAALGAQVAPAGAGPASGSCDLKSAPGLRTVALTDQGQSRPFILYVPAGYDGRRRVPLVVNLHGSGGNGSQQMDYSRLAAVADARGFAVAAPSGAVKLSETGFAWNVPGVPLVSGQPVPAGTPSDKRYLLAVIRTVGKTICNDPRRVYVTGYSGGARMTSQMACDFPTRIAAIAPVAGLRAGTPFNRGGVWGPRKRTCNPKRPVPVVAFHGTADTTNPFEGNDDQRWGYSVPAALTRWAAIDGCRGEPATGPVTSAVDLIAYRGCKGGSAVRLYRQNGAGHIWPAGAGDGSVDANNVMWSFFKKHRLPAKR
jgi:polyhydroxybutyrate depolymerase